MVDEGGGNSFTVTLDNQYYNGALLQAWLQTYLNANTLTALVYTVTYDQEQSKFTISATGAFDLQFSSSTGDLATMLGFSNADTGSAATHTSNQVAVLSKPMLYLSVQPFPTDYISTGASSVNFALPVTGNFGDFIHISQQNSWFQQIELQTRGFSIKEMVMSFTDQAGNVIDFNGVDTYMIFTVKSHPRE